MTSKAKRRDYLDSKIEPPPTLKNNPKFPSTVTASRELNKTFDWTRQGTEDPHRYINSSVDVAAHLNGKPVEVFNYAYSKFDNNGGLFPHSHAKRGHIRSFKKMRTVMEAGN